MRWSWPRVHGFYARKLVYVIRFGRSCTKSMGDGSVSFCFSSKYLYSSSGINLFVKYFYNVRCSSSMRIVGFGRRSYQATHRKRRGILWGFLKATMVNQLPFKRMRILRSKNGFVKSDLAVVEVRRAVAVD